MTVLVSPKCAAQQSKWLQPFSRRVSLCRYRIMVYNSVMELLMGVPVAKITPRPPVFSSRYWHFIYISEDFWASVVEIPATFCIFVYKKRFLYECASSTNSRSTPSCSKVTTSSFFVLERSFSNRDFSPRFVRSMDLTVNRSAPLARSSAMPSSTSAICFSMEACCRSKDMGIFSN